MGWDECRSARFRPWQRRLIKRGRTDSRLNRSECLDAHVPVLAREAFEALAVQADGLYIDATFGRGGHTALILGALGPEGRVLAFDRDPAAIEAGHRRFPDEVRLALVGAPFADIAARVPELVSSRPVRGILFDLGVSSPQLDDPARGFSFRADGPLDMRMDPTSGEPVSAWLARAGEPEIREVIATLGEERFARRIAADIVAARSRQPLTRTLRARRARRARSAHARARQTSGDAHVPGAAHAHQRRARASCAARSARALELLARRRPARGDQLPFARRPHRQAVHPGAFHRRSGVRRAADDSGLRAAAADAHRSARCAPAKRNSPPIRAARSSVLRVAEKVRAERAGALQQVADRWRSRCCGSRRSRRPPGLSTRSIARASCSSSSSALNVKRDNLEIEWGQLQLEQSAWSTHAFVENVAGTKLKMGMPPPKDIELSRGSSMKVFPASAARRGRGQAATRGAGTRDDPQQLSLARELRAGAAGVRRARARVARGGAAAQGSQVPGRAGRRALLACRGNHRDARHDHGPLWRAARGVARPSIRCG